MNTIKMLSATVLVMLACSCANPGREERGDLRPPAFVRPGSVVVAYPLGDFDAGNSLRYHIRFEILELDGIWAWVRRVDDDETGRLNLKPEYYRTPFWINVLEYAWGEAGSVPANAADMYKQS